MLTRAGRRRQALRHVEHAAEHIQLPWLCPALGQPANVIQQKRSTTTRPTLSQHPRRPIPTYQSRTLASAAPFPEDLDGGEEYLPFSYEKSSVNSSNPLSLDLSNILQIDSTTALPPSRLESYRNFDSRADVGEIEATLEACLHVQRWDRAEAILDQLRRIYSTKPSKLQEAYNRVLEAMVFDLIWNRATQNEVKINQWIEVNMRSAGVDPNAQTFALKIKVALATMEGAKRDRTVRRYWEMAKDYQFENQVASLRHILSDHDLGKLTEICPLEIDFDLGSSNHWEDLDYDLPLQAPESASAEVRETEQKGLGLVALRKALSLFTQFQSVDENARAPGESEEDAFARIRQTKLEQDSLVSAVDRWKIEHDKRMKMGVTGNFSQGKIGALMWQWHELLAAKITAELKLVEEAEVADKKGPEDRMRCEYGPFLRLLDPKQVAALTTISAVQIMSQMGVSNSITVARLVTQLGRTLEAEVDAQQLKDRKRVKRAERDAKVRKESPDSHDGISNLSQSSFSDKRLHWTVSVHAKVGAILCEMLMNVAKMTITKEDPESGKKMTLAQPVFIQQTVYRNGKRAGVIKLHEVLQELMVKQPAGDVIAKQLPMVSKPKPWRAFADGGYYSSRQPVLRVKHEDVAQRDYSRAAAERGDLDQMFAALDVLGKTAWKINKDVFEVMLEAWNSGEAIANLPPADKVFPELPKPAADATPMEKWKYFSKLRQVDNEKSGMHSNRCFQNFQMEIARAYLDETFYLPHNVDFRGRAYPIPPYLNQMGADNARGLLLFAKGRELGPEGLKWVKVHLSNVYGYDKASLEGRAQFAMDHLEDIKDSVANPLGGKRWWLKAEDPWQCLAACHELIGALSLPDPSKFISFLPIHQDGTCNGLQHYAALGGDVAGARQVNLEPGDKPADVYTGVAELVRSEIKQDVALGVEIAQILDGRITRKIVKQTVMTNVYGVTFTGAIRQVRKQLDDLMPDLNESNKAGQAATYIARKIFKGLGTLFNGAHEIQYWLGDCANRITHSISPAQIELIAQKELRTTNRASTESLTKPARQLQKSKTVEASDFRSTVVWTTPLKLPVVQPYRVSTALSIQTSLQGVTLVAPSVADSVDPRKQLQGFPPNFVHSLDATHMMLSALKADEIGINFSAVHDSFWTHAADIPTLNTLLRDAFIRMHSEDIISRLAAEFRARYQGHLYLAKVAAKSPIGKRIRRYRQELIMHEPKCKAEVGKKTKSQQSQSALQKRRYSELVREIKRTRLLASEDAAEREEGKKMVTASSIFEKYNGEKDLAMRASLGQTAVGEVPEAGPNAVEDALKAEVATTEIDMQHTLEPLIQEDSDDGGVVEASQKPLKKPRRDDAKDSLWLWLPLKFRDVPAKGEFDVRRLKDSTYFFS